MTDVTWGVLVGLVGLVVFGWMCCALEPGVFERVRRKPRPPVATGETAYQDADAIADLVSFKSNTRAERRAEYNDILADTLVGLDPESVCGGARAYLYQLLSMGDSLEYTNGWRVLQRVDYDEGMRIHGMTHAVARLYGAEAAEAARRVVRWGKSRPTCRYYEWDGSVSTTRSTD